MKFLKFLLISTGSIVGVAAIGIGAVLVLTGMATTQIDVQWNEDHWQSYLAKSQADYTAAHASAEDMVANNINASGVVQVSELFTNEELSAAANKTRNDNSLMNDILIKCNADGTLEASCVVGSLKELMDSYPSLEQYSFVAGLIKNRPVYLKTTLEYSSGRFRGSVSEVRIGKISVPLSWVESPLKDAGSATNDTLGGLSGFVVDDFKITADGIMFSGSLPERTDSDGPLF